MAHYKLYKIHLFLDGNKRICRLIFNKMLIDDHFPLINISVNKEAYFDSLILSVETNNPK
jgi:Fic/DOC family.